MGQKEEPQSRKSLLASGFPTAAGSGKPHLLSLSLHFLFYQVGRVNLPIHLAQFSATGLPPSKSKYGVNGLVKVSHHQHSPFSGRMLHFFGSFIEF